MNIWNTGLEQRVESLCEQGCRAVLDYIEALQSGQTRPEYADLDSAQRALLLHELQGIMAVYDNRCSL